MTRLVKFAQNIFVNPRDIQYVVIRPVPFQGNWYKVEIMPLSLSVKHSTFYDALDHLEAFTTMVNQIGKENQTKAGIAAAEKLADKSAENPQ